MKSFSIKFAKIAIVFCLFFSSLMPFLNGLGCDFSFYYEDGKIINHGVCRAGVLDVVISNKESGSVVTQRMLWGVLGEAFFGYIISREVVKPPIITDSRTVLFDGTGFIAGRYYLVGGNLLATYIKHPVEMVRLNYLNGNLAFKVAK
ncbi:hypothetical protein ACET6F_06755 [Aeromonas veronii]